MKQGKVAKTRMKIQKIKQKIVASIGIQPKTSKINRSVSVKVGLLPLGRSGLVFNKNSEKDYNKMIRYLGQYTI